MSNINISSKYRHLFNPPSGVDTFVITGGRFSQKSFAVGLAVVHLVNEYNHRALYSRFTQVSAKDSIVEEITEKISMLGWESLFEVKETRVEKIGGKGKIVYKGLKAGSKNQTANLKGLKDFSIWVLDEAEELKDYDIAEKTMLSIRGNTPEDEHPNFKIFILNPSTTEHWVYQKYFEERNIQGGFNGIHENVCYIHTSYLDCIEFCPFEIRQEFERMKERNPKRYNNIVMGGWLERAEGVVYTNWSIGDFPIHLEGSAIYPLDFGFTNPTAFLKMAVDFKTKKIYIDELCYKSGLSSDELERITKKYTFLSQNKKGLIVADSADPRQIHYLAKRGLNIVKCVKGEIVAGIREIQDFEIIITPNSVNVKKELNNYVWSDNKAELAEKKYDHAMDAMRYGFERLVRGQKSLVKYNI
jgi:phage terminase large subunit